MGAVLLSGIRTGILMSLHNGLQNQVWVARNSISTTTL